MDLSLNEQQQLLKQGIEDFMAREAPRETVIEIGESELGYSPELYARVAELGWLGTGIPEEYGGAGLDLTDSAVLFEAFGHAALPGPFLSSAIVSAFIVDEAGSEAQRAELLPRLASGQAIATLALTEPSYGWGPEDVHLRAQQTDEGYRLNGTKLFVHDALGATHLVTAVRTDEGGNGSGAGGGLTLLLVDAAAPGVSVRRLEGFVGSECAVRFEDVLVPRSAALGEPGEADAPLARALTRATPVLCAYQVGGAQAVFEMAVEYSRERRQFGQPIGRFQHVQNHIIQLVNHVDAARWTTYEALWRLDTGKTGGEVAVHLAKAVTSEGYVHAVNYAHEVHAGVGVMHEYGLTLYTRLSRSLYHQLGSPKYHRRRLGDLLVDHDLGPDPLD